MKLHSLLIPAILAPIAWFGACTGPASQDGDGVNSVQFRDMVIPSGLRLIDAAHESHSAATGQWRHGRFVYGGLVEPDEAAAYVRQQMPRHNWELVKDETTSKHPRTTTMRYVRGQYVAEYVIARIDGRTQMVIEYDTDYTRR